MKNARPKVTRVSYTESVFGKAHVLFDNGRMLDEPVEERHVYMYENLEDVSNHPYVWQCEFLIDFGGKEYKRSNIYLHCNGKNRKILKVDKSEQPDSGHVTFLIDKTEWRGELLGLIREQEKDFYLSEDELLLASHDLLKEEYSWVHFKNHVEINGSIADGLAFVNHCSNYNSSTKIIGFEAKTNRDNYLRLYGQLSSYLSICDEVYLVIEDKAVPADLPFYVGIIQVQDSKTKVLRRATSLKHSIDVGECWKNLLKSLCINIGLKRETPLIKFFHTIEDIKRKLIWNQFVIGWHQTYVKEYVQLTDEEKKLVRLFFEDDKEKDKHDDKTLMKILTLDHWAQENK